MIFPFQIKEDIFVCVLFGLVWVLTFGATQQSTQLMYNSVVDLFFQFMNCFWLQFCSLELFLFLTYSMDVNGNLVMHSMTRTTKTEAPKSV